MRAVVSQRYLVNECFYSLQGEGARAGTPNIFLRFAKCNLKCNQAEHGFDCDTDFEHGGWYDRDGIVDLLRAAAPDECRWVILTGGEPALQVDVELVQLLRCCGYNLAIETNGTKALPFGLDWICVSPKPGAPVVITEADEVKVVLAAGMELPDVSAIKADWYVVSPAFDGEALVPENVEWCRRLVLDNPDWRLSTQMHKAWGIR
jgi:7-carboxy-7-deazaguanine synthase